MQNNPESETLEFKLHSFRASQRYLAHKNPTHSRGTAPVFKFSARSFFERTLVRWPRDFLKIGG